MAWFDRFPTYMRVGDKLRQGRAALERLYKKTGRTPEPVAIEGRKIATTFWGVAWCENLERYSDFASRLPRGRTYARNGSVLDLWVEPGVVHARVAGSELYTVEIRLAPLAPARWRAIARECAGRIGSLIALLRGELSGDVLAVLTRPGEGVFPEPREIELSCSCPDGARMCKHVAASLYGVGARLDTRPELFFVLRQVNQDDLIAGADAGDVVKTSAGERTAGGRKRLAASALAGVFGIELEPDVSKPAPARPGRSARKKRSPGRRR